MTFRGSRRYLHLKPISITGPAISAFISSVIFPTLVEQFIFIELFSKYHLAGDGVLSLISIKLLSRAAISSFLSTMTSVVQVVGIADL